MAYTTSLEHILAELERLDLLVRVQVTRAQRARGSDEAFQGLYISEQEIEALLARSLGQPRWATDSAPVSTGKVQAALDRMADEIARHKAESSQQGVFLRLDALARLFDLTPFDIDTLLICLVPELDRLYERFYAYLQDDVTRRHPSVDLVLNLLFPSFQTKLAMRRRFAPEAPLRRHDLLCLFCDPSHPQSSLLSHLLKVDDRVVSYLLDEDEIDARILPYTHYVLPRNRVADLILPDDVKQRLTLLAGMQKGMNRGAVFYFQGPYGVGKQTAAEALCEELGIGLLVVDGAHLLASQEGDFEKVLRLCIREALLKGAALYWTGFDALLVEDKQALREALVNALEDWAGVTFLTGDTVWEPTDALHEVPFVRIAFPRPGYAERKRLWTKALDNQASFEADIDLEALANAFRFSGGQIRDAAATARNLARGRDPKNGRVTRADLYAACRLQSNRNLGTLAREIKPHYRWEDIVLSSDRMAQLREICSYVKHRALVYDAWGFDRKLAMGKGLNALFAGPSGTGKTMAADIIAGELGLDLYKIDLSTVVSKYIGETEKNLSRIFAEAETSNAILFFDEADALFGKRSEVRDAHDRYANIEISYLLQKMEEYDGVVILATNLRKNMDEAFVRRMHFTIEFPFPSEKDRCRIWKKLWPDDTPRSPDLDLDFMARRFEIAGGNIRNIALTAAFLAAADGKVVNMRHLIHATQREYQKMGNVVMENEFGEYARLTVR